MARDHHLVIMRPLPYELCDVFTDRVLAGNALAVFTDASGLDDSTMQALAREMNLSESAFVLEPSAEDADARVRIFTPTTELTRCSTLPPRRGQLRRRAA